MLLPYIGYQHIRLQYPDYVLYSVGKIWTTFEIDNVNLGDEII